MKPMLQNAGLEKQLADNGYVVIPFLTASEVSELKDSYYEHHPKKLEGMYATAHVPDLDLRMKMNNVIKEKFARAIAETFCNATPLGGSFIAKGKGDQGTLKPHQDWNIVDETKFRSFNIWVPLVDLTSNNGAIRVMPKSHLWHKTFRSANTSSVYQQVETQLWESMSRLDMKAGEALIYDHRLIHASPNNHTEEIRLATVYGIIPDEARMFYYHQKDESTIEEYESNPEFFLYGNIFQGPKGLTLSSQFNYQVPQVAAGQFARLLHPQQDGILQRIRLAWKNLRS
jgi:hypothetical protein